MSGVYFTSDTHFGHEKVLKFEAEHRPFKTIKEHDEALIARWNKVVHPKDIVYHLGDLYLGRDVPYFDSIMERLNGRKILVRGNHDTLPLECYAKHFKEVHGVLGKYGFVMSHVPLHPDSVERWGVNVHGHLHSNQIKWYGIEDNPQHPSYYCVSVEQHNLTPVNLNNMRKEFV